MIAAVADALQRSTGPGDLIARDGGDEFIIFLPAADDAQVAELSNKIAQNVYNITLSFDRSMQRIVVNIGAAQYPESGSDICGMLSFVDPPCIARKTFAVVRRHRGTLPTCASRPALMTGARRQ